MLVHLVNTKTHAMFAPYPFLKQSQAILPWVLFEINPQVEEIFVKVKLSIWHRTCLSLNTEC